MSRSETGIPQTVDLAKSSSTPQETGISSIQEIYFLFEPDDYVGYVLRRLADGAKDLQWRVNAPFDSVRGANEKLRSAIATLGSYLVMSSINERFGRENTLRLQIEVMEHKLAHEAIALRVNESEILYLLKDQQLFHQTGITTADINAVINAAQAGFQGLIYGEVN